MLYRRAILPVAAYGARLFWRETEIRAHAMRPYDDDAGRVELAVGVVK